MLNRKLTRDVWGAKGLLLTVASIVAIGVTVFVAMRSAYHNLSFAKQDYYRRCRMADFWIDVKKLPLAEVPAVASIPGISELHARIQFAATVDLDHVIAPVNGIVVSLPDRRQPVLNGIVLQQGDYFTDRRRNEVILNDKFARTHRLLPGHTIHLLLNNRREELFIVGTAISSEYTYLLGPGTFVPDSEHFGVFYLKHSYAEEVFDFQAAANSLVGRLAPESRGRVDEILRVVESRLEPFGVMSTTALEFQSSNQFLSNEIDGLGTMAFVMSSVFLSVAATVLNILINRLARRQRVVIGTLKALGYSDGQVFRHFMWFGLIVGASGAVLGSFFGYFTSMGMTSLYRLIFQFPNLRSGFYWSTHGAGLFVSLSFALLGSMHGARRMLQLRPAEAMRPEPPRSGRRVWIEFLLGRAWQRLNWSTRTVLRGLSRNRLRTTTSLFAATMSSGLLVHGFMMVEGQEFLVDFQFSRASRSDVDLTFKSEEGAEALDELRRLTGVSRAEPQFGLACTFVHGPYRRKGSITGIKHDARLTVPHDDRIRPIAIPEAGVVLTQRLADKLHARVGDQIMLIPVRGERRAVTLPVARIADSFMGLTAYADIRQLSRLVGEPLVMNGAQLTADESPRATATMYRELKQMPGLEAVQSRRDLIDNITKTLIENQYIFIGLMVSFSGVMLFGSIVNSSLVNFAERQAEVATLRAIGYSERQVGWLFFQENMLITVSGAMLGLPAGYGLTYLLAVLYDNDLLRLPVVTAPWVWWLATALSIAFGCCAQIVVQWTIRQLDVAEALKVRE